MGSQRMMASQVTLSQRWIDSVSSNFEHLLWYITYESSNTATDSATGRRASARATIDGWMKDVKTNGRVQVEVPVGPVEVLEPAGYQVKILRA